MSNQVIFINVGLSNTQDGKLSTMDQELVRWIVETKFPHCGVVYGSDTTNWTDSEGVSYDEECLAFRILVPKIHAWTVEATQERINSIRVLCKQDAVAFHTISPQGRHYREVHYGPEQPRDALVFNEDYFHYVV